MPIDYDTDAGITYVAFRVRDTVIPEVLRAYEFWLLLIVNIFVQISRRLEFFSPEAYNVDLPWGLTGTTGSLMTFFVCFYNGSQFGRYNKLYDVTQDMFALAVELASMARVQIPDACVRRKTTKLIMASIIIFFFAHTKAISKPEWRQLYKLDLLNEEEITALRRHIRHVEAEALPSFLPLQWACELIKASVDNPADREDLLAGFFSKIFHIRRCQASIVDLMELPMPFQYFHIMNLMLMINLILWAYALGCQDSYWSILIYMFSQMMFQGLRELSTSLADPFGDDDVDFPVDTWVKTAYMRVWSIVEDDPITFDELCCSCGAQERAERSGERPNCACSRLRDPTSMQKPSGRQLHLAEWTRSGDLSGP